MRIVAERQLACSPEVAFALLAMPEAVNRWAFGTVRSLALGDGHHPGGVGALREVQYPGWPGSFTEVVEVANPPGRFVWRATSRGPIREQRSDLHLSHGPRGTHLRATLEFVFAHQTIEQLARFRLEPGLRESFDNIVKEAERAERHLLPPVRRVDAGVPLTPLQAEADASLDEQWAHAESLQAEDSALHWLAWVHAEATRLQLEAVRAGRFQHPAWVLRLVPRFHRYHVFALDRARRGVVPEPRWQAAFDAVQDPNRLLDALELSLKAHMEADLPRALAETYVASYQSQCDYDRLRGDFLKMGEVLEGVAPRIFRRVEEHSGNRAPYFSRQLLPSRVFERAFGRRFRTLMQTRGQAFAEGETLTRLIDGASA